MRAAGVIQLAGSRSLSALCLITLLASATHAVDRFYVGPTGGPWTLPTSWNSKSDGTGAMGLPNEGDILFIRRNSDTTVNFNLPYMSPQYAGLYLEGTGGAQVTLSQTTDSIAADFEVIAQSGRGQLIQSGGSHDAGDSLII